MGKRFGSPIQVAHQNRPPKSLIQNYLLTTRPYKSPTEVAQWHIRRPYSRPYSCALHRPPSRSPNLPPKINPYSRRFQYADRTLPRFEQLTLRANALREELHTEIEKILNDVIKFKVHIQQNLENYEAFVDQEVKAELDEGGAEDEGFGGVAGMDE